MMQMLAIYTAQWESIAAREEERLVGAQQARGAHMLSSATKSRQAKQRSERKALSLKRLVSALGYT